MKGKVRARPHLFARALVVANVGTDREHFRLTEMFANSKNLLSVKLNLK